MDRSTTDDGRGELDGIDLPSNAYELGVDERGATHYHSALEHKVWVVEDGEIAHEFDVDDIQDYEQHVADTRGWEEFYLSEGGFAETLAELVTEAVEESGSGVSA